jgi:hypothetical protein
VAKKKQSSQTRTNNPGIPFPNIEHTLEKMSGLFVVWVIGLGILFALLLFNARILETDDGLYIEGGYYYAKNFFGYFFTSSAPLYVMFLALPIALAGVNVLLLKSLSIVFYAVGLYLLYRTFRGKMSNVVFLPAFVITAFNATILSYASLTFTESFYMMLQSLFLFVFIRHGQQDTVETEHMQKNITGWLFVGVTLILLSLTKNIAVAAVGGATAYFLFFKKYKNAIATIVAYGVWWGIVEILKRILWGDLIVSQYGGQSKMILLRNPYDPNSGIETISGFVDRFFGNAQIFLSSRFLEILTLRRENSTPDLLMTIIVAVAIIFGLIRIIRNKEKPLLAMALYAVVVTLATFIALHTSWGQTRYIMIFVPFFLIIIFYGAYDLLKVYRTPLLRMVYILLVSGLLVLNVVATLDAASTNFPTLQKNLRGDTFAGYPEEWANYLRLSQWCADSLDANAIIACRKPSVSFIYARGRNFRGIYNVPSNDPDTLITQLQKPGVTHIILDNIAGTVYRYMSIIEQKHPGTFVPVHQIGYNQTAAYLFKINYPK